MKSEFIFTETYSSDIDMIYSISSSYETIVQPAVEELYTTLRKTINQLKIKNEAVEEIGVDIINACLNLDKTDIIISKTAEREILIYRKDEAGAFRNILIDEEGDIEYLFIPRQRQETSNEYYKFYMINEALINELAFKI